MNTPIYNKIGVARKGNLTDNVLFYIHNETSYPWLVNDQYKMCYSMPTHLLQQLNQQRVRSA